MSNIPFLGRRYVRLGAEVLLQLPLAAFGQQVIQRGLILVLLSSLSHHLNGFNMFQPSILVAYAMVHPMACVHLHVACHDPRGLLTFPGRPYEPSEAHRYPVAARSAALPGGSGRSTAGRLPCATPEALLWCLETYATGALTI